MSDTATHIVVRESGFTGTGWWKAAHLAQDSGDYQWEYCSVPYVRLDLHTAEIDARDAQIAELEAVSKSLLDFHTRERRNAMGKYLTTTGATPGIFYVENCTFVRNTNGNIMLVQSWQSIETAPKDETYILLYFPYENCSPFDDDGVITGFWREADSNIPNDKSGWYHSEASGNALNKFSDPTHWMPCPRPPHER